jgi:hypothetical protein
MIIDVSVMRNLTSVFGTLGRVITSSSAGHGWSWKDSNFHPEDLMDSSYTNPTFVPVYSLDGIDDQIKKVGL